uniref:N(6)-L-threonylcarbamoyladenine synthase n=1 Tax=Babesia bovis TaxID=5865 RepID=A7APL5_BABBO|eukprot:XP_001612067.1 glycoprotease family protein [Babesia bovis T2Bo]
MFDYINNGKYIFCLCVLCNLIFDIGTRCVAVSVGVRVPLRSLDSTGFLVSRRLLRHPKAHWLHSLPISTEEDVRCSYTTQLESCLEQLKSDCPANGSNYYILAIETSCDDCCAAVVSSNGDVVSEERASNPDSLIKFGGIKPDESYRFHLDNIDRIMNEVVSKAKLKFEDIGYIVATRGPGMRICLNAGYDAAERISKTYSIPLIGENHLAGHCLSPFIKGHQLRMTHDRGSVASEELKYPYLSLLLSGGHSQIYVVESPYQYHMLVDTMDHYAGNVLYKCAKELGLPIDTGGGPSIEEAARKRQGRPMFRMTEPCKGMSFTSFCFSGIQTQLRSMVSKIRQDLGEDALSEDPKLVNHLAYTCQEVTFNQVIRQLDKALDICETLFGISQIVVVGGRSGFIENKFF